MSDQAPEEGWWLASDGRWYPPTEKPHYPLWRRAWVRVACALAVVAIGAGAFVLAQDGGEDDSAGPQTVDDADAEDAVDSEADDEDTSFQVAGRSYEVGDCVTWDVDGAQPSRTTVVVDCDEPHRIEVTGVFDLDADEYPSDDEWDEVTTDDCRSYNEAAIGGPMADLGLAQSMAIWPSTEGWLLGDREVTCAVARFDPEDPETMPLYTGLLRVDA